MLYELLYNVVCFFLRKKNLITDGHYIVINIELTKMNMKNCVFIRKKIVE